MPGEKKDPAVVTKAPSIDRSVPSHQHQSAQQPQPPATQSPSELILSISSMDLSHNDKPLFTRDSQGNVYTNLNIQENNNNSPQVSITHDHVKYINLFAILCCWCFPITGLLTIFFARKTRHFFDDNDLIRAKWYLNRAEWMLLLTFFFGLTIIATVFAFLEAYWFKSHSSVPAGVFHSRSLP